MARLEGAVEGGSAYRGSAATTLLPSAAFSKRLPPPALHKSGVLHSGIVGEKTANEHVQNSGANVRSPVGPTIRRRGLRVGSGA